MQPQHKSVAATVEAVESEHPSGEFQLVLSNDSTDRDGESLKAADWMLPLPDRIHVDSDHAWEKGMSVPLTVGSGVPSIDDRGRLVVKGIYAATAHAQLVRSLVNDGHIWQGSVSFLKRKTHNGVKRELLNGTFTGVPSNPDAVVLTSKSVDETADWKFDMTDIQNPVGEPQTASPPDAVTGLADAQKKSLEAEFASKLFAGQLSENETVDYQDRWDKLDIAAKNVAAARRFGDSGASATSNPQAGSFSVSPELPEGYNEGIGQRKWDAGRPQYLSERDSQMLFEAGSKHTTFGVRIAPPGFNAASLRNESHCWTSKDMQHRPMFADVQSKANPTPAAEGTIGSILPAELLSTGFPLRIEPVRLLEFFPGAVAGGQGVTFLQHTANANPAAAVAELALKPDLAPTITPTTVSFTTIAGMLSVSRQFFDDWPTWGGFAPAELYRAIVAAENAQILTGSGSGANMLGLMNQPNTLTRVAALVTGPPSTTEIDVLRSAVMDLRQGPEFCVADLIILNVQDWDYISKLKTTQNQYVLSAPTPNDIGYIDNLFGTRVISTTTMPQGKALVLDTRIAVLAWTRLGMEILSNQFDTYSWQQNAWSFRGEERIAIGVQYPKAMNIVTGLNPSGGS
jgi:hypothetical protein